MKHILLHGLGQDGSSWDQVIQDVKLQDVECPNLFTWLGSKPATFQLLE